MTFTQFRARVSDPENAPAVDELPGLTLPPRRRGGWIDWHHDLLDYFGEPAVFALNNALICLQHFCGYATEPLVFVYGGARLAKLPGVVLVGEEIEPTCVLTRHGVSFTDFDRTLADAMDNEDALDMQGTVEALSHYYFTHNESFAGLHIAPRRRALFASLADWAKEYYTS